MSWYKMGIILVKERLEKLTFSANFRKVNFVFCERNPTKQQETFHYVGFS